MPLPTVRVPKRRRRYTKSSVASLKKNSFSPRLGVQRPTVNSTYVKASSRRHLKPRVETRPRIHRRLPRIKMPFLGRPRRASSTSTWGFGKRSFSPRVANRRKMTGAADHVETPSLRLSHTPYFETPETKDAPSAPFYAIPYTKIEIEKKTTSQDALKSPVPSPFSKIPARTLASSPDFSYLIKPPSPAESPARSLRTAKTLSVSSSHPSYTYEPSQRQPLAHLLPPSTRPRLTATYLKTPEQQEQARRQEQLLGSQTTPIKSPIYHDYLIAPLAALTPSSSTSSTKPTSSSSELVYNITTNTFHLTPRSILLPNENAMTNIPMIDLPENQPPFLTDGRRTIIEIPRWSRRVRIYWRTCTGTKGDMQQMIWEMNVKLPLWVVWERNFSIGGKGVMGRWKECFVER